MVPGNCMRDCGGTISCAPKVFVVLAVVGVVVMSACLVVVLGACFVVVVGACLSISRHLFSRR